MLLGVRPDATEAPPQGHRTRVYIPYGEKWYEYSIRRLQEKSDHWIADCQGLFDAMDESSIITFEPSFSYAYS